MGALTCLSVGLFLQQTTIQKRSETPTHAQRCLSACHLPDWLRSNTRRTSCERPCCMRRCVNCRTMHDTNRVFSAGQQHWPHGETPLTRKRSRWRTWLTGMPTGTWRAAPNEAARAQACEYGRKQVLLISV